MFSSQNRVNNAVDAACFILSTFVQTLLPPHHLQYNSHLGGAQENHNIYDVCFFLKFDLAAHGPCRGVPVRTELRKSTSARPEIAFTQRLKKMKTIRPARPKTNNKDIRRRPTTTTDRSRSLLGHIPGRPRNVVGTTLYDVPSMRTCVDQPNPKANKHATKFKEHTSRHRGRSATGNSIDQH